MYLRRSEGNFVELRLVGGGALRERCRSSWLDPYRGRTMFTRMDESAGIAGAAGFSSNLRVSAWIVV